MSEVDRVTEGARDIEFVQPHANDNEQGTKTSSLEAHLLLGSNIATTHKMYERLVPMVKAGLLDDYDIIIDEVPDVVRSVTSKSRTSIQEFYVNAGYMDVDVGTGLVRPTSKWRQNQEQVSDTLSPKILKYAESGCLYLQDGEMFIWALPQCILSAGNSVTVMTYKAEGSMLLSYLRKLGLSFEVSNDNDMEEDFRTKAAKLITIEDIGALSKLKLTYSGQEKGISSSSYCSKVSRSLKRKKERKKKETRKREGERKKGKRKKEKKEERKEKRGKKEKKKGIEKHSYARGRLAWWLACSFSLVGFRLAGHIEYSFRPRTLLYESPRRKPG